MPRPFSRVPLVSRVPLPVRRAALLLGVIAAVVGLPGTALAAVHPASPAAPSRCGPGAGDTRRRSGRRRRRRSCLSRPDPRA